MTTEPKSTEIKELLPCPFCGGEGETKFVPHGIRVICSSCGSCGVLKQKAEEADYCWNTRHNPKKENL